MGRPIYLKNVTTLGLDPEKCIGCGKCLEVCPHSVFSLQERKARIVERDACMECGACSMNCPTEAISVQAGVGCAAAVINAALGRTSAGCCSVDSPQDDGKNDKDRRGVVGCRC